MGAASPREAEMNAQRTNWHALDQVVEWQRLGKAVARAEWVSAGEPEIDAVWIIRGTQAAAQVMNDSIAMHGAPPELEELAQAKRIGQLDQMIADANRIFWASKARHSF
jgi:hypothetical protein